MWSSSTIWRGPVYYSADTPVAANTSLILGPWDFTPFSSAYLQVDTDLAGATVTLQTSPTPPDPTGAFATLLDQMSWRARVETGIRTVVPLLGNWTQLKITTVGNGGLAYRGLIQLQSINGNADRVAYPVGNNAIGDLNVPLPLGGASYFPPNVQPGLAGLFFDPGTATDFEVAVSVLGTDGTPDFYLYHQKNIAGVQNVLFELPDQPIIVQIFGTTGALFSFSLTPGGGT